MIICVLNISIIEFIMRVSTAYLKTVIIYIKSFLCTAYEDKMLKDIELKITMFPSINFQE